MKRKLFTPINIAAVVVAVAFAPQAIKTIGSAQYHIAKPVHYVLVVRPLEEEVKSIKKIILKRQNKRQEYQAASADLAAKVHEKYGHTFRPLRQKIERHVRNRCEQIEGMNWRNEIIQMCRFTLNDGRKITIHGKPIIERNKDPIHYTGINYMRCAGEYFDAKPKDDDDCKELLSLEFLDDSELKVFGSIWRKLDKAHSKFDSENEALRALIEMRKKSLKEVEDKLAEAKGKYL